jgi:branched-chain amino acid transport system ATP-binding protein
MMMTTPILSLRNVYKSFGKALILNGVNLELFYGERHAVIGPNGAGKSTLFHLISGQFSPNQGEILLKEHPIQGLAPQKINHLGLSRSFQITNIFPRLTVFENLRIAVMQSFGLQYTLWKRISGIASVREKTEHLLELLRLSLRQDTPAGELSYSEQRSLEIGMTLASDPEIILLDEPMAGMSREETDYTINLIREVTKNHSLLIIEHDMDVVFSLSDRISVLVYGSIIATGTPDEIRGNSKVQEAYLGQEAGR